MADYWVYDGAGGAGTGADWTNAYTSIGAAQSAGRLISGNRIFIADDHDDPATATITGPTSGLPVEFISCDRADTGTPPAYKVGTGSQIYNTASITLDGSFALHGLRIVSGGNINLSSDNDEFMYAKDCKLVLAANGQVGLGAAVATTTSIILEGCLVDLTADLTTGRIVAVFNCNAQWPIVRNLTFTNPGYRTGVVIGSAAGAWSCCDFSGFDNGTLCEIVGVATAQRLQMMNCKTVSTSGVHFLTGTPYPNCEALMVNVGDADAPEFLFLTTYTGTVQSNTSVYLDATVETVPVSWKMDSNANCSYTVPLCTPWIYGVLATTGSKTFTIHVANNTADLNTAEAWIEVEYMGTANSPLHSLATDRTANVLATGVTTGRDEDVSWTGSAGTYEQKFAVTATVGEEGMYRARVCVGKASVSNLYVDPKVIVT